MQQSSAGQEGLGAARSKTETEFPRLADLKKGETVVVIIAAAAVADS